MKLGVFVDVAAGVRFYLSFDDALITQFTLRTDTATVKYRQDRILDELKEAPELIIYHQN